MSRRVFRIEICIVFAGRTIFFCNATVASVLHKSINIVFCFWSEFLRRPPWRKMLSPTRAPFHGVRDATCISIQRQFPKRTRPIATARRRMRVRLHVYVRRIFCFTRCTNNFENGFVSPARQFVLLCSVILIYAGAIDANNIACRLTICDGSVVVVRRGNNTAPWSRQRFFYTANRHGLRLETVNVFS